MSLLFLFSYFYSDGSNQHIIWAAGGKSVFIWEAGWEQAISMERHDPKEPVLLQDLPCFHLNRLQGPERKKGVCKNRLACSLLRDCSLLQITKLSTVH
jgi:hypothetical protein